MLGGITIIGMWWAYFDRLADDAVQQAGRGWSKYPYLFWLYLHLPLTIALTVVGVGLTLAINAVNEPVPPGAVQWLLVGSVADYYLAAGGISLTKLLPGPRHSSFVWGLVVRLGLAAILLRIRMSV